jgi:N-methylhydantoinase A/oxoprolinase/acetone carboxylase beta subunit
VHVGADTGGTFTDVVVASGDAGSAAAGTVAKVLSTPSDPAEAVRAAVDAVAAPGHRPDLLAHGSTVATNAVLEHRLARTALVATRGFADIVEIARQVRPSLYDQRVDRVPALVPRALRFEVAGRLAADGTELEAFDGQVPAGLIEAVMRDDVDAIAVCLLHADLEPAHERAVLDALAARLDAVGARPVHLLASHEVAPQFREYERTVTTVVDAGLVPTCRPYLEGLASLAHEVLVMTSAGGLVALADAVAHPARLLVSGPAAGVRAAAAVAAACGYADAVSFDMGGTSTDVCLVRGGVPDPAPALDVGGYPVQLPALGVHTIGAGGGSIARIDPGGALVVGPESAGAVPGPASYGRGGAHPTVTDADVMLGRISEGTSFPGIGRLDRVAAGRALGDLGLGDPSDAAAAVVAVVDAAMERAVRVVSVEQGVDPRALALVAFGGAGPLHACAVADALGMDVVIVPARAGVLSAVGLTGAPREEVVVQSWPARSDRDGVDAALDVLAERARARLAATAAVVERALDCRYEGQSHELTVAHRVDPARTAAWDAFHQVHQAHNGFARRGTAVEVVALRVRASVDDGAVDVAALPPIDRQVVVGPAVAAEDDCTVWVPARWVARPGPTSAWVITRG